MSAISFDRTTDAHKRLMIIAARRSALRADKKFTITKSWAECTALALAQPLNRVYATNGLVTEIFHDLSDS